MKKSLFVPFCFSFILITAYSCTKQTVEDSKTISTLSLIKTLVSSNTKISETTKVKVKAIFGNLKSKNGIIRKSGMQSNSSSSDFSDVNQSLTFDNGQMASYENTSVQAIIFEQPNSLPGNTFSFVAFQQYGLIGDMAMYIQVEQLATNQSRASYYDLDYNLVAQFIVEDGIPSNFQGFPPQQASTAKKGWWGRWGSCVSAGFNSFFNGNPLNAAAGLTCVAFGPACAAGGAVGCAAAATFQ